MKGLRLISSIVVFSSLLTAALLFLQTRTNFLGFSLDTDKKASAKAKEILVQENSNDVFYKYIGALSPEEKSGSPEKKEARNELFSVEVSNFNNEADAQDLSYKLLDEGIESFVMPLNAAGKLIYSVRTNPTKDKKMAEELSVRIEKISMGLNQKPRTFIWN